MEMKTLFKLVNVPIEPPMVEVPAGKHGYYSVGTLRDDGGMDLIATLNIEGIKMSPVRRVELLRLLQMLGEGCCTASDRSQLRILARQDAPDVVLDVTS